MPKKNRRPSFVDPNKDPLHYINRYYKEPKYKEWFDRNYPDLTIEEAVGLGKEKPKSKFGPDKIFVIGMAALVIVAFFFIQTPDTLLGGLIAQTTPVNWDEILERNIVKQSIPIVLLQSDGFDCMVQAHLFDAIIDHPLFVRGEELAEQLNFNREDETLILPCDLLYGEKTRLIIWNVLEESKDHPTKFEYWTKAWKEFDDEGP